MPDLTVTTLQATRFWVIDEHVPAAALQHFGSTWNPATDAAGFPAQLGMEVGVRRVQARHECAACGSYYRAVGSGVGIMI
jgi:hypothetical protein